MAISTTRENQRAIVTYITPELHQAMREIALRKRMTITALVTRAVEDFLKKSAKSPAAAVSDEQPCVDRANKRAVTTYLDLDLFNALHEVVWRKRTSVAAATARAIKDFVRVHGKILTPA